MIKQRIIFTIIFFVVLSAIVGFITYSIITKEKESLEGEIPQGESEITNEDPEHLLIMSTSDLTIFKNETRSIKSFIVTINDDDWQISITSDSSFIKVDEENFSISGVECANDVPVTITVSPNFNVNEDEFYKDKVFPRIETFKVTILPNNVNLDFLLTSSKINEFEIKVSSDIKLKKENLTIKNLSSFSVAEITEDNQGVLRLKQVNIVNKLKETMNLEYCLKNDLNEEKKFYLAIEIEQDKQYLSADWITPQDFTNKLYVTKDDVYDSEYPNQAQVIFINNFDIDSISTSIELAEGDSEGLIIEDMAIGARKPGLYVINIYTCGMLFATESILVANIPVIDFTLSDEVTIEVGEQLDLTIHNEDIDADELAVYDIVYELRTQTVDGTINANNVFSANEIGDYVVRITVGEISKEIVVHVIKAQTTTFGLIDKNRNSLEYYEITLENLNHEVFIECYANLDIYQERKATVTCEHDAFIMAEISLIEGIALILDKSNLQVGDVLVLTISLENGQNINSETCFLQIVII